MQGSVSYSAYSAYYSYLFYSAARIDDGDEIDDWVVNDYRTGSPVQTTGTNVRPLQIPMALPYQAMFQAFVLTYGTEQRFDASSHTIWREEAVTTWDTMLCDGKWFRMAMQVKWASMQCFPSFQIKLPVFCMNTMIHRTPLWPCLQFPWTGVMSVFTASSDQIRYYEYEKQNVLCA